MTQLSDAELRRPPRGNYSMAMPASTPHYTIDMLDAIPQEPGARYELVDGHLIVTPAPGLGHATVAWRISMALGVAIPESAAGFGAPGEIRIDPATSLEPDILVYPARSPRPANWRDVSDWWLAVEVVSPSSRHHDRQEKRRAYLALGVPDYWVADPETRTIEVWRTDDSRPRIVRDQLSWTAPSGHRMEIDVGKLFEGIGG
jgi:Uma2 family endonuclease